MSKKKKIAATIASFKYYVYKKQNSNEQYWQLLFQ